MRIAIHQPGYLPWGGFFAKMIAVDAFVFLDTVQMGHRYVNNRNRILYGDMPRWLTVPTKIKGQRFSNRLCDIKIDNTQPWRRKHSGSIHRAYSRTRFFSEYWPMFRNVYAAEEYVNLVDLNMRIIALLMECLEITVPVFRAYDWPDLTGTKDDLLLAICRKMGAISYVSGAGALEYTNPGVFRAQGVELLLQRFEPQPYPQPVESFFGNLSVLDPLFRIGPERTREWMEKSRILAPWPEPVSP